MRNHYSIFIAIVCFIAFCSTAQEAITNAPKTEIENFELQPDVIIVKGIGDIGSLTTGLGSITVRAKESSNLGSGRKEYGIAVALESKRVNGFIVVDDEELEPLIHGMDVLGKISYNITTMPSFNAAITTKSGLKIAARSQNRRSSIQFSLQFADAQKISLTSDQFTQFENLIKQAKDSLDNLKSKGSGTQN